MSNSTRYEHIFEFRENGNPQRLVTNNEEPPSESKAAAIFEVDQDEISYILTQPKESSSESKDRDPKKVPCNNCERDVIVSHERAARVKHSDNVSIKCGRCATAEESDDE